jgi:homoserine/homoserine lactone efflux protein
MTFDAWLAFCLTEIVLCATPGPAVLLVVSVALARGARGGMGAALGVLVANTLYFALSAAGIGAALVASHELFLAIKWVGAAYLVWLGARMLFSRRGKASPPPTRSHERTFLRGLVVQGANPKALIFFTALLPQFVDPDGAIAPQVLLLGFSSVAIEIVALAFYACGAARLRRVAGAGFTAPLERLGGAFLVAAGARLAWVRSE